MERSTASYGAASIDSPTDVPAHGWRDGIKRAVRKAKQDRITLTSAGVAFWWFLAVFPMIIAAVGFLALFHGQSLSSGLRGGIDSTLPSGAAKVLTDAISSAPGKTSGSLVAAIVAIALALYSASSGMAAAQEGLDVAYDVPESRKFLKKRVVGVAMTLAALALGGVATGLLVFGQPIGKAIGGVLPISDSAFVVAWTAVRWILTVLAVMTLFAVLYSLGPNRRPPNWKWVSPGSVVAAVIWLAASLGFSFYVSNFGGSYAKTYGSLAGVVILMLWLYFSALALLFGAEINGELEREKALREGPVAGSEPGHAPRTDQLRRTA
jgi:membrane protein